MRRGMTTPHSSHTSSANNLCLPAPDHPLDAFLDLEPDQQASVPVLTMPPHLLARQQQQSTVPLHLARQQQQQEDAPSSSLSPEITFFATHGTSRGADRSTAASLLGEDSRGTGCSQSHTLNLERQHQRHGSLGLEAQLLCGHRDPHADVDRGSGADPEGGARPSCSLSVPEPERGSLIFIGASGDWDTAEHERGSGLQAMSGEGDQGSPTSIGQM